MDPMVGKMMCGSATEHECLRDEQHKRNQRDSTFQVALEQSRTDQQEHSRCPMAIANRSRVQAEALERVPSSRLGFLISHIHRGGRSDPLLFEHFCSPRFAA